MNDQQLLAMLKPRLASLFKVAASCQTSPSTHKMSRMYNELLDMEKEWNRLNAPGPDITQTDFFTAIEGK